ncbi:MULTISPECIES: maltose ABC transporter permease MalF [Halocynthiibacter]|uniref:Maltose/maltodextrin transport system permease protein n=1 Tax=Halocynthiibacter halioticoli TaxID=2986804 RepID=A0AAE3J1A3_9RHOB|nr:MULTISPECIES: maltose ABC transporter permease MalF [Halocynthiibacter]MCV6825834.1 maltose ABC transporter permease MalF [Halocynthiibacter halioticoli]MCW4058835.1 maltose ABC transporter permease MalF [Halocynthiibacter sp. SDUM655004]
MEASRSQNGHNPLQIAVVAALSLILLYGVFALYLAGQAVIAVIVLAITIGFAIIFGSNRFYAQRFIFPGIAAIILFIAFPVAYTVYIGFTNYSSFNLLTFERVTEVHLSKKVIDEESQRPFSLVQDGDSYQIFIKEGEGGYLSEPTDFAAPAKLSAAAVSEVPANPLKMGEVVKLRGGLAQVEVVLPDETALRNSGLRSFASVQQEYTQTEDGTLVSNLDGSTLTPDQSQGFYITETGEAVAPGWRVNIGLDNFRRIANSKGIRAPMVSIFVWTVVFATLSVGLTFAVGLALAMVLQWPHLRGKTAYRILLILPYAVPAFISILVFRGLFNQNFGEINMILEGLFGIRPNWFTDGGLARLMLVIVNTWLGYPYMMLLAMGFLQSVPADHHKAAALEGAPAWTVFRKITLPQIIPPFLPLLIASFAFNFNNIVLVLLLTRGLPDIPGTIIPAGETDILGSFTFRMAFMDSGQQFGLAGAITFLIFLVVAALAYANFVAMRRQASKRAAQ